MPSWAAIMRLGCCKVTDSWPCASGWACCNSHSAQRASASKAKRLTDSSTCCRCAVAISRMTQRAAWGSSANDCLNLAAGMRRTRTSVCATISTTAPKFRATSLAFSHTGPSALPSWCTISFRCWTPNTTRPASKCTAHAEATPRLNNTVASGSTICSAEVGSRNSTFTMPITVHSLPQEHLETGQ